MHQMKQIKRLLTVFAILWVCIFTGCGDGEPQPQPDPPEKDPSVTEETPIHPQGVIATDESSSPATADSITVSWNPSGGIESVRVFWFLQQQAAEADAASSHGLLFQSVAITATEVSPKLPADSVSYSHSGLAIGDQFFYLVKFYGANDKLLGYSAPVRGSSARLPSHADATKDSTLQEITVSWEWNTLWPLDSFSVYRSETVDGSYQPVGNGIPAADRSWKDTSLTASDAGKSFFYKIAAVVEGKESLKSNYALGKTLAAGVLGAPLGLSASEGLYRNRIVLSWSAPSERSGEVARYLVYIKEGGTWSPIPVDAGLNLSYELSTTDSSAHSFYVCAESSAGEGAPSIEVVGSLIPVATGLTASYMTNEVSTDVSWNAVTLAGTSPQYRVYRSSDAVLDGADQLLTASALASLSFGDNAVTEGEKFYYMVTVLNDLSSEEGLPSAAVQGVRGIIPQPTVSLSQGTLNTIRLTFDNYKSYLTVSVTASRQSYAPHYFGKPMFSTADGTVPTDYDHSLEYKYDPKPAYSAHASVLTAHASGSWDDNASAPGKNRYLVQYHYHNELHSTVSVEGEGYRLVSDSEFLTEFLHTIAKSQFKMHNIHQKGMDANGADGPYAGEVSGEVFYNASVVSIMPIQVEVPITYTNYCDYYLTLNDIPGNVQMSKANSNANGVLVGGNVTTGIYEGEVVFDLVVTGGKKTGGQYLVKQKVGGAMTAAAPIVWDFDRAAVNAYLSSYPY